MAGGAALAGLVHGGPRKHLARMAAEAVFIGRFCDAVVRFVTLVAVEPRHRRGAGEDQFFGFFVTRETHIAARYGVPLFLRGEGMAHKTRYLPSPHAVNFPSFMAAAARLLVRPEGMHRTAVAIHTGEVFHDDMPGMAHGSVHGERALRNAVPVTFRTRLPGRQRPMGLRLFPAGREYKLDKQFVLLKQSELMAFLAHDDVVRAQLPRGICFPHEVATAAEVGVLLDVVIVPDGDHNAEGGDDEQQRNEDHLFPGAEATVKMVEYFGKEFVHLCK